MRTLLVCGLAMLLAACGSRNSISGGEENSSETAGVAGALASAELGSAQRDVFGPALGVVGNRTLYIDDFGSMRLFADERLQAQRIIADWAASVGFRVVPPEQSEAAIANAVRGLHPITGKACGPELSRPMALARTLPDLEVSGRLGVAVYCKETCFLRMELELFGQGTEFFGAPFDAGKPWREELLARLKTVRDIGGHGKYGHANNPVAIVGVERDTSKHDFLPRESDEVPISPPAAEAAQGCGVSLLPIEVLVEKSAGQPARCEPSGSSNRIHSESSAVNACVCKAIVANLTEESPRRVVTMPNPSSIAEHTTTRNGKKIEVWVRTEGNYSEEPWQKRWDFPHCQGVDCSGIDACFVGRTDVLKEQNIGVTVEFDSMGRATNALFADFSGILSKEESQCLVEKFKATRVPCPGTPTSVRTTTLRLAITEP